MDYSLLCDGAWHFFENNGSYFKGIWIGRIPGDVPVPADYDGDGREDPAIFRDGVWMFYDLASKQLIRSAWTGATSFNGDAPQPAPVDRDADGLFELSLFSGGPWQFYNRDGSFSIAVWTGGVAGDQPISRRQHVNP